MKRMIPILLALLLLAACGAAGRSPAQEPESVPSLVLEPAPASEPEPEPVTGPDLRPGRILAAIDEELFAAETARGTQADLDRWKEAVNDPSVAWLELYENVMGEEKELPVEEEQELLTMLREAQLRAYGPEEEIPNPYTGGAWTLMAYDGEGSLLFYAHFIGNRFYTRFEDGDTQYLFDGEGKLPEVLDPEPAPELPSDAPDPGIYAPDPSPTEEQRDPVDAMADYLEKNLDSWDYSEIWRVYGEGGCVQVATPFPDAVKAVVDAYPGVPAQVEYFNEQFSKGQLDQAKADLEQFLAAHPEIPLWDWRRILLFGGYQIELKENSDALTEFIEGYSIPGVYQVKVYSDEPPAHPD